MGVLCWLSYQPRRFDCATCKNWKDRILNYFDGRHSNGFAEGVNLKVKLINRRGFGYRNFANFRLHVLTAFGQ